MIGRQHTGPGRDGRTAFWLLPAEPWRVFCEGLVTGLARRFGTAVFAPHVTVHVDGDTWERGLVEHLEGICRSVAELDLRTTGLSRKDKFTESLVVLLETNRELEKLCRLLRQGARDDVGFSLNPHLSLIYGIFDANAKDRMEAALPPLPETIGFDRLAAVYIPPGPVLSNIDVGRWNLRCSVALAPRDA